MRRHASTPSAGCIRANPSRRHAAGVRAADARCLFVALACVFAVTLAFSTPALAGPGISHPFLSSFDGTETPQGAFTEGSGGGLAISESSGRIIVAEQNLFGIAGEPTVNFGIGIFSAAGNYITQIDDSDLPATLPHGPNTIPAQVAVDNSGGATDGEIYVASDDFILVFDASGTYLRKLDGSNTPAGSFVTPRGVAVDSSGNVYVADTGSKDSGTVQHFVIDKFDADGHYLSQVSGAHVNGHTGHLAVDSAGSLYAVSSREGVAKFSAAGLFQSMIGTPESSRVAIDTATNDVYVDDGRYLAQYDSTGKLLGRFGSGQIGQVVGGVSVNGAGRVYAIDDRADHASDDRLPFRVVVFGPSESTTIPDVLSLDTTDEVSYFSARFHGVINPNGVPTSYRFEYREEGSDEPWKAAPDEEAGSGTGEISVSTVVNDLQSKSPANGRSYEVRLVATSSADDASVFSEGTDVFSALPVPLPTAAVNPPSAITATTAHLSGVATLPSPGFDTSYRFSYQSKSGGGELGARSAGSGPGEVPVADDLSGLDPNTEYSIHVTVSNAGGKFTSGDRVFTTAASPPSKVETIPPGALGETSARLGGWVDSNHSLTSYWLEYGTNDCASQPCASAPLGQDASAGSANSSVLVTQNVTGLSPATVYHYRIVAKNQAGTTIGNDIVFTTDDPSAPGPPDRGIELVNSPDKGNQPLAGGLVGDGSQALWKVLTGVPGSPSGVSGAFRASRMPTGWQSQSVLPSLKDLLSGGVKAYEVKSISPDVTRYLFLVTYLFNGEPEYALVDPAEHTQLALGSPGPMPQVGSKPTIFGDEAVEQVYAFTRLAWSSEDKDGRFDMYAYDESADSWTLASLRPDGSDPTRAVDLAELGDGGSTEYSTTSDGLTGEKKLFFLAKPTDNCSEPSELYVRDIISGTTTAISAAAVGGNELRGASLLQVNSAGTAALFATSTVLSIEDENNDSDIYQWEAGSGSRCITCLVSDAGVESAMASPDLSYVYFSSSENLVPGRGLSTPSTSKSLYVVHEGQLDYVAPVDGDPKLGLMGAYRDTSTDGSVALFMSNSIGVTADVPQNAIYRYEAGSGELQCVSCSEAPAGLAGPAQMSWVASRPRGGLMHALDSRGADIVFVSDYPISPRDVNGAPDIYEWRNGKTRLITDGVTEFPPSHGAPGDLNLSGISSDGKNVAFISSVQLTGYEIDHQPNFYVASVGGGFPRPAEPPAPCNEDSCQGPLQTPPRTDAAGSSAFSGPGSSAQKHKRHTKKHKHRKKRHQASRSRYRND